MRTVARASMARITVMVCVVGVLVAVLFTLGTGVAQARVYCTTAIVHGWCKNPDGTYSYRLPKMKSTDKPIKVYSASEFERMGRAVAALALVTGPYGHKTSEVPSIEPAEAALGWTLAKELRHLQLYVTPEEVIYGSEFAQTAREIGQLPELAPVIGDGLEGTIGGAGVTLAPATSTVVGGVVIAAAAGIAIGTAFDEIVGWPSFFNPPGEAEPNGCPRAEYSNCEYRVTWGTKIKIEGKKKNCSEIGATAPTPAEKAAIGTVGKCIGASKELDITTIATCEFFCESFVPPHPNHSRIEETEKLGYTEHWSINNHAQVLCPLNKGLTHCVGMHEESGGWQGVQWVNLSDNGAMELAYPAKGLDKYNKGITGTLGSLPENETFTPTKPSEMPVPRIDELPTPLGPVVTHFGEKETEDEEGKKVPAPFPGLPPEGEPEGPAEGEEIPSPEKTEIPIPKPGEKWQEYLKELEEHGFQEIVETELSDTNENPEVGPEGIARVSPAPGSEAFPTTRINVDVNPKDAPIPGGGGKFEVNVPELKLPKLGVVCKNFPFGVPCWLIEEFAAWSGTSSTPTLTFGSFKVKSTTIGPASVSLGVLEPIMSKVRPFMVLFATIGLVLLFYKFAMGGGPPSGGGGGTDEEQSESEESF